VNTDSRPLFGLSYEPTTGQHALNTVTNLSSPQFAPSEHIRSRRGLGQQPSASYGESPISESTDREQMRTRLGWITLTTDML
jgi:hypothetical protein